MLHLYVVPYESRDKARHHQISAGFLLAANEEQAIARLCKYLALHHQEWVRLIDDIQEIKPTQWDAHISHNFSTFKDALPPQEDWLSHDKHEQIYLLPGIEVMNEAATQLPDEVNEQQPAPPETQAQTLPFCFKLRVRYGECDAQNVVFNARYGDYVDLAATEFMRALIGGYQQLLAWGFDNQVVRLLTEWKAPAHFDDVLQCWVSVTHIGRTSFTFTVRIENAANDQLIANSEATYVLVDAETHQKQEIPDALRSTLSKGAPGKTVDQSAGA